MTTPTAAAGAPANSYARITHQYIPAAVLVIGLAVALSAARRELIPGVDTFLGDLLEALTLAAIAITLIGIAIVRPFERRMHERRRVAATRERAYREETERREFERRMTTGLELCETDADLLATTRRALLEATAGAPAELLLAGKGTDDLSRAVVTGPEAPSCSVASPDRCPATRRGVAQRFEDSESIDACPLLRGRPEGRIGAVCVPVAITGRALGVVHAVHKAGVPLGDQQVGQLVALANHVGARIGVLRLTAAAHGDGAASSHLVQRTPVAGAPADGPADEGRPVTRATAAREASDHEVAGVGAATAAEGPEGGPDRAVERDLLGRVE